MALVAASGFAVGLMAIGMAQFTLRRQGRGNPAFTAHLRAMCALYLGGLYVIYALQQS